MEARQQIKFALLYLLPSYYKNVRWYTRAILKVLRMSVVIYYGERGIRL